MEWLSLLRHEIDVIGRTVRGLRDVDLVRAVPGCPGWTVRDLVVHIGSIERWVVDAIEAQELSDPETAGPATDLPGWYEKGAADLLEALDVDPRSPAATFASDRTVGFWQRRQVHEHRVHRWDLQDALGRPEPLAPAVAHDGLDEIATMFWPRQVRLGRAAMPARGLSVVTTDTGGAWVFGEEAVATLSGPAADLILVLMHRGSADASVATWSGDEVQGRNVLGLALTP